ncbi:uncharacterized protein B0P05DRAFT_548190 [Gilbertella persicaria]|uniref:uncharacterized protein n=1 Tax=Gilbertella persicaria TaxID=101096 RepID=UPI002220E885|nr:uncharacterized protein B0P05DRAFT_548190 [Gilbertella persicaria]KAI8074346.1 hypothetical protein B0P05DRAFT_548190 [Gilbertella persicaria]
MRCDQFSLGLIATLLVMFSSNTLADGFGDTLDGAISVVQTTGLSDGALSGVNNGLQGKSTGQTGTSNSGSGISSLTGNTAQNTAAITSTVLSQIEKSNAFSGRPKVDEASTFDAKIARRSYLTRAKVRRDTPSTLIPPIVIPQILANQAAATQPQYTQPQPYLQPQVAQPVVPQVQQVAPAPAAQAPPPPPPAGSSEDDEEDENEEDEEDYDADDLVTRR